MFNALLHIFLMCIFYHENGVGPSAFVCAQRLRQSACEINVLYLFVNLQKKLIDGSDDGSEDSKKEPLEFDLVESTKVGLPYQT